MFKVTDHIFDMNINWSSWPASAWFYNYAAAKKLSEDNYINKQVYMCSYQSGQIIFEQFFQ